MALSSHVDGTTLPSASLQATPITEQPASSQVNTNKNSDACDDEFNFVLGWRHIRAGEILSQGVANHTISAGRLPEALRAALLEWLKQLE